MVTETVMHSETDILVVGAGLAGLVVAYRIAQGGLAVTVVEARDRPGGRIHSLPQALGTPLTAELGGEAFDSDHVACLSLAQSLGLPIVDLWQQVPGHLEDTYWFEGQRLDRAPLQAEWTALLRERAADWQQVQQFIQTGGCSEVVKRLDAQSIPAYLIACGASPQLRTAVSTAYTIKYGMDAEQQSCLNLLGFFRTLEECAQLFGGSDERYYIQGGNEQLPQALFATLADRVQLGTVLEALAETADGCYRATLRQGNTVRDRIYSRVVLTVPFSVLRHIPLRVELPPQKRQAIQALGYNSPTKLISAYTHKPWHTCGSNGLLYTDLPMQHCWEASDSLRSDREGLLVAYPGGKAGHTLAHQDLTTASQQVLQWLDQVFPGLAQAQATPTMLRSEWLMDPFSQGAYACYEVGQWSAFYGCEGERVGNLFFAGEQCSRHYQGYMEGACETAEQVALALLSEQAHPEVVQAQRSRLHCHAQLRRTGFQL